MELVEGESLTQIIERIGAANMLDWKRVLRISYYLAKALGYAHSKNIVHRNLTPQNVMVGKTPESTKLGDLMLAKAQEGRLAQQITKPGELIGDIRYMPPERTGDAIRPDGRSDLYSLGALMYALLTGRAPFDEPNVMETIAKICHDEPVRPRKFQMTVVQPFEGIVMKLLLKRPAERYPTAEALIKDFDRVAKQYGVTI
jgi:eukaryotic-like serine/threonine-protein kinase